MNTVTLPQLTWGRPDADRRVLLVHGLGSDKHTMWEIGEFFAAHGWFAVAVDQRGHGEAPRVDRYRIEDYAADLLAVPASGTWDLVIGHSIGGASVVLASSLRPEWAARIALIDPALATTDANRAEIRARQIRNHREQTIAEVAGDNPTWHPRTVEAAVVAQHAADEFALIHSVDDNPDWDVLTEAKSLTIPALYVQGDPAVLARYTNEHAESVEAANPLATRASLPGTGHNPHRDNAEWFCRTVGDWVGI